MGDVAQRESGEEEQTREHVLPEKLGGWESENRGQMLKSLENPRY